MTMFSVPFYRVLVLWRLWTLSYGVILAENKLSVTKVNPLQITKRNEVISRQIPRGLLFKQYRSRWERYRNPTETSPAENLEKPFEPQASRFERPIRPRSVTILGLSTRPQSRKRHGRSIRPQLVRRFGRSIRPQLVRRFGRSIRPQLVTRFGRSIRPQLVTRFGRSIGPQLVARYGRSNI